MDRRIARSVQIEAAIEAALTGGVAGADQLSDLGRLGAQLILQRAVEDELAAFLWGAPAMPGPPTPWDRATAPGRDGSRPPRARS